MYASNALTVEEITPPPNTGPKTFCGASAIHAIAHWAPGKIKSSGEVESLITKELPIALDIEERIGVKERRVVDPKMSITDMSMAAIDELLKNKNFNGEKVTLDEVDLIIYFSVAREVAEPATAVFIQDRLGLDGVTAFDVSDACLGFIDAWSIADAMIENGRIRKALLVSAERISGISDSAINEINKGENPLLHYAALSLGDGACAVLVGEKTPYLNSIELVSGCRETYGKYSGYCILPSLTQPMLTQAGRLFNVALKKFPRLVDAVLDHCGWGVEEIDTYIAHQASMPSIRKGADAIRIPHTKTYNTIQEYGNMASVSVPFTLSKSLSEKSQWSKQRILLVGFGSGLGIGVFALQCK